MKRIQRSWCRDEGLGVSGLGLGKVAGSRVKEIRNLGCRHQEFVEGVVKKVEGSTRFGSPRSQCPGSINKNTNKQ